jgi:hypothetical protein
LPKCPYDSDDENAINKERKKQKKKMRPKKARVSSPRRRRMMLTLAHGIVMLPQVMKRKRGRARRRDMLALPSKRRSPYSTLPLHASWPRPQRYKIVTVIVMKKMT